LDWQLSDDPQVGKEFALKNVLQQTVPRLGQPKDILHDRHNLPHRRRRW
jgi:hypothetical protein